MSHPLIFGLLLGWGAAIPVGPINLEIIRRNLRLGTPYGIAFGTGACSADVTYLVLLSLGVLAILTYPLVLEVIGILGSLILAWFGYAALRMNVKESNNGKPENDFPLWRHSIEGYFLTLINPMTILFWSSVSAQVALFTRESRHAPLYAGLGVLLGTFSWIIFINCFLHFTRHRLPPTVMQYLNYAGGVILLGFAVLGFWRVFA